MSTSLAQSNANSKVMAELRATFDAQLHPWRTKSTDPREALAELEERRVTTREIQARLMQLRSRFSWDETRPIGEWLVEMETVRSIAVKLQAALGNERVAATTRTETLRRRDQLQALEKKQVTRIRRLSEADSAFQEIKLKHSLEIVTRSALGENRESIESIFAQIHSPAEFNEIAFDDERWTLKRKGDDQLVSLTQISTGQRAAFALSVFLAQNAQLRAGPPVILIDDPIAHVDDLNALSFLDYLRDLALTGKRQIFFATASDKLASLFERKFDFLGGRFKRFNLTRAAHA